MGARLPLWILALTGLFLAQLSWWGYSLWSVGHALHQDGFHRLQLQRDLAATELEGRVRSGEDRGGAWRELATRFPGVTLVPGAGELEVQVSATALAELARTRRARRVMVLGEGSLFLAIAALAVWFLLRGARHERQLALQESNFLHAVTHEFRSPLQSLRLAIESLQRRPDPQRAVVYAAGMLEDLARLDGLVENVLAVGRLDAQAFRAQPRRLDLAAAVREELARYRARDPANCAWLEVDLPERMAAEVDPVALGPILGNLLENARKYGGGRPARLELAARQGYAELALTDQGCGFSASERKRLFERFWRAGDERVRTAPGSGLGLYLVRELALAQGATVQAYSAGPGEGATFTVRWPLAGIEE